jgi:predicted acetyltransferase
MDPEYRDLPEDYGEEFDRLVGYAFRPETGPQSPAEGDGEDDGDDGPDVGQRRGVFDGDDLLAVCRQIYWPSTVRDEAIDLAGLSAVASPPENRRQGVVATMLAGSLEEYHERGCEFAALWPFRRSFYGRYGWGTANAVARLEAPVEALSFADAGERSGAFRRVGADDWAALDRVYRDHTAGVGLAIDRDEEWWRRRVFQSWGTDPYVYAVDRNGDTRGYVVYRVDDEGEGRTLEAYELAWRDRDAFRDLVRFCYYHDSQVDAVELHGRPGGGLRDLLDAVPDPNSEDVAFRVRPGPMVRVVDVPSALEVLRYPEGVDDRLSIRVSDPLAGRNDGTFVLDVAGGRGACDPADGESPELECSVGTLSGVAVGYRPVDRLRRTGDLGGDEGAVRALAAAFPPARVHLGTFF